MCMSESVQEIGAALEAEWDDFVALHPLGRAFATTAARTLWTARGYALHLIAQTAGQRICAGAALVTKPIPHVPFRFARIEALMPDGADVGGSSAVLIKAAEAVGRRQRVAYLQIPFWIPEGVILEDVDYAGPTARAVRDQSYTNDGQPMATYLADLGGNDEALLERFTSKCRRDVRKGLREGVQVTRLETAEELTEFCERQLEMSERKGVGVDKAYVPATIGPLFDRGHMMIFAARHEGRICNMAMIDALGIPRYTLGTATPAAFEKGVPPTGQPLHFEIMRCMRDRGKMYYDLGGVPGPVPVEGHPSFTVWRFKHEFGAPYTYMLPLHSKVLGATGRLIVWIARRTGRLPS